MFDLNFKELLIRCAVEEVFDKYQNKCLKDAVEELKKLDNENPALQFYNLPS